MERGAGALCIILPMESVWWQVLYQCDSSLLFSVMGYNLSKGDRNFVSI